MIDISVKKLDAFIDWQQYTMLYFILDCIVALFHCVMNMSCIEVDKFL